MRLHEFFRLLAFIAWMDIQEVWQALWKVFRAASDEIKLQLKGRLKSYLAKVLFGFGIWFPKQKPTVLSNRNHDIASLSGACAWADENAGLRRDAVRSQVIDALRIRDRQCWLSATEHCQL